jgi:hypothetical protein
MTNWYIDYHHAQLLRLLSMVIVFGVLGPSLCLLITVGSRLTTRFAERVTAKAHVTRDQAS